MSRATAKFQCNRVKIKTTYATSIRVSTDFFDSLSVPSGCSQPPIERKISTTCCTRIAARIQRQLYCPKDERTIDRTETVKVTNSRVDNT